MASAQYTVFDLYSVTINKSWDEVRDIIRAQPQLVKEKYHGVTSLFWIVRFNAPKNILLEVLNFATVDAVDDVTAGRSIILHHLARNGHAEPLRRALEISTTRVNWQTEGGNTPLHWLLHENHSFRVHLDATQALLDVGAESDIKNKDGLTPVDEYTRNECRKYDDTSREQQKEELLQLLQCVAVPGVILARGEEAVKVFKEELEKGQITLNHARLMVTGKEGVGKTCLVNTLLDRLFNEHEPSTDGIVLTTAFQTTDDNSEWKEKDDMDDCERTKQMYDNALEGKVAEKLKRKGSQTEPSAPVPIPVSEDTPELVPKPTTPQGAMPEPPETENIEGDLPANRTTSETLSPKTRKRIVKRLIRKISEASGHEDITYIWDFAGQQLYYITHRIFLTSEAVYLILFNLMENMYDKGKCRVSRMREDAMTYDMTNIQIITYWMRLIYTYAVPVESQQQQKKVKKPQIVVVGTHSESLQGTEEDKKKQIAEQFAIIFQAIKGTPYECHVVRKMYAIDNKFASPRDMMKNLKQDVGGFLKAMPKTIPLKWLEFQRLLQEFGRTAVRMPYAKVCKVATDCGISVKNLIHTLNYLHDLGIILYFENNKLLKHTVIINPRKLIDIFRKIITVLEPDDDDKWSTMIRLWNKLDDEGILEEELARHVWREELKKDGTSFEVFLELMKQFGLLCEQIKNQESTHRSFFVPCRLKRSEESMAIEPDTDQMVSIYVASEDFLPDSMFHPLVVSLIGMVQDMGYTAILELFSNKANIGLGHDHNLCLGQVVIDNNRSLKLEISRMPEVQEDGTETPTGEPNPRVCMQVLEFLKEELTVLTSGMKHTRYEFRVLCRRCQQESHFHNLEECLKNDSVRCRKKSVKTSKLKRMFKSKTLVTDGHLGYLEDKRLCLISNELGPEWKQLGLRLGLSWKKIKQICYPSKPLSESTMDMLTEWRKRQNYETNQVEIMGRALKEQQLTELAIKVFGSQMSEDQPSSLKADDHGSQQLHRTHHENDDRLADIDMLFIAERLEHDWKTFGIYLGLKRSEINQIESDFSPPMVDASLEMLVKWRERQEANLNQLVNMSDALNKLERGDINDELQTYYREKYQ